jgi:hypothetical protein
MLALARGQVRDIRGWQSNPSEMVQQESFELHQSLSGARNLCQHTRVSRNGQATLRLPPCRFTHGIWAPLVRTMLPAYGAESSHGEEHSSREERVCPEQMPWARVMLV